MLGCLKGGQPFQFSAYIRHTARDDHPPGAGWRRTGFHHTQYAQRPMRSWI